MTETPKLVPYKALYIWTNIMLGEQWGLHAKCWKAERLTNEAGHHDGCFHALVLGPDPLRNRPLYQLQVEGYTYLWNDGVRTTTPDSVKPSLEVLLNAKMQLMPPAVILGVFVEHALMAALPLHVLQGTQVGEAHSVLDRMGGKPPSLLHKA